MKHLTNAISVLIVTVSILLGCSSEPFSTEGYCVPEAIYSAWVYEAKTGLPARIAVSHIKPGIDHAQAQGFNGKEWFFLTTDHGPTREYKSHFPEFEPYRYLALDAWVKEQTQYRHPIMAVR